MKNIVIVLLSAFLSFIYLLSCDKSSNDNSELIIVASETKYFPGEGKEYLLVQTNSIPSWHTLNETIVGFNYEKGYEYTLEVVKKKIDYGSDFIQDAPSFYYLLIKVTSKEKKKSNVN